MAAARSAAPIFLRCAATPLTLGSPRRGALSWWFGPKTKVSDPRHFAFGYALSRGPGQIHLPNSMSELRNTPWAPAGKLLTHCWHHFLPCSKAASMSDSTTTWAAKALFACWEAWRHLHEGWRGAPSAPGARTCQTLLLASLRQNSTGRCTAGGTTRPRLQAWRSHPIIWALRRSRNIFSGWMSLTCLILAKAESKLAPVRRPRRAPAGRGARWRPAMQCT